MTVGGPQRVVILVAGAAIAATVAIAAVPSLRFAYHAPDARVALETATTIVALVAAYLMLGRFVTRGRLESLWLAAGLAVLALTNLVAAVLVVSGAHRDWRLLSAGGDLAGAALFAAAALAPAASAQVRATRRDVVVAVVLASAVAVALLALDFARAPEVLPAHVDTARLSLESSTSLLVAELAAIVGYGIAAIGFARRAAASGDRFLASVAVGSTLAAFAVLHYMLFAPASSELVRSGDLFRVLFYAVLIVGAAREVGTYWRGLAETAVLEERRRIARDLHDGVAQELAFIGRRARRLGSDAYAHEIAAAAERALNDSRRAIAALTQPLDRSLADVIAEALDGVAGRHGVELDLRLEQDVDVSSEAREALARIGCEAVANAARHAGTDVVRVELAGGDRVRFAVSDTGRGFDPVVPAAGRFGLTIMRERAEAVGATFRVHSRPGAGTTVEVVL